MQTRPEQTVLRCMNQVWNDCEKFRNRSSRKAKDSQPSIVLTGRVGRPLALAVPHPVRTASCGLRNTRKLCLNKTDVWELGPYFWQSAPAPWGNYAHSHFNTKNISYQLDFFAKKVFKVEPVKHQRLACERARKTRTHAKDTQQSEIQITFLLASENSRFTEEARGGTWLCNFSITARNTIFAVTREARVSGF